MGAAAAGEHLGDDGCESQEAAREAIAGGHHGALSSSVAPFVRLCEMHVQFRLA
jgi:hypothetical protein